MQVTIAPFLRHPSDSDPQLFGEQCLTATARCWDGAWWPENRPDISVGHSSASSRLLFSQLRIWLSTFLLSERLSLHNHNGGGSKAEKAASCEPWKRSQCCLAGCCLHLPTLSHLLHFLMWTDAAAAAACPFHAFVHPINNVEQQLRAPSNAQQQQEQKGQKGLLLLLQFNLLFGIRQTSTLGIMFNKSSCSVSLGNN